MTKNKIFEALALFLMTYLLLFISDLLKDITQIKKPIPSTNQSVSLQVEPISASEFITNPEEITLPLTPISPTEAPESTSSSEVTVKIKEASSSTQETVNKVETSPAPTISPNPTPAKTLKITTPKETPEPKTSTSQTNSAGLDAEKLFGLVNDYRASKNLPVFEKDDRACQLATERAPEIDNEIVSGHMHQGLKDRNLPYWNSENIISMKTEQSAFNWWINDYIHRVQIEGDYKYSCIACSGHACAEEFTNFIEK